MNNTITFTNIATISSPKYPFPPKPSVKVSRLANHLSTEYTSQSNLIKEL